MPCVGFEDFKILYPIVSLHTVSVMDDFRSCEKPTQVTLHHKPVLQNIVGMFLCLRVTRRVNFYIAVLIHNPSTFPTLMK